LEKQVEELESSNEKLIEENSNLKDRLEELNPKKEETPVDNY